MPDLDDFYAFKMTSSDSRAGDGGKYNSNNNGSGGNGCTTTLIVLAILGWVLLLIGKM